MLQKLQETLNKLTTLFSYIKLQIDNKLDIGSAAATADKLTAPFTLALSGDATATAQVDGGANVTLAMLLKDIGVTAGSLGDSITIPVITVDSKGRVTQMTGVSVRAGTTAQVGVVQLSTSVSSASAATAATSGAVKAAYDLAATKLDVGATAAAASKLITARTISLTGDGSWSVSFDGAGNVTGIMTLANSGVVAGTHGKVTVDSKGRVISGEALTELDIPALAIGKITNLQASLDAKLAATAAAVSAAKLTTVRSISITGDATWTINFDGSAGATGALILANTGVAAGSYTKVTVNAKGLITAGTSLVAADIPALDASKTTTGVFAASLIPTLNQNTTGNAATATSLATPRYINGVAFSGISDITVYDPTKLPLAGGVLTGILTGGTVSMSMSQDSGAAKGSFVVRASGTGDANLAGMSFHNDSYAIKMGVRADGVFGIGGWSRTPWSWYTDASGNMVAAGNVSGYSDPRLKENFKKIDNAFNILDLIDGGTFDWKHGFAHTASKAGKHDYGILADQVQSVMPEIVTPSIDIDGEVYLTVDYSKIVPVLIEAVKQLRDKVDAQEERLALLNK